MDLLKIIYNYINDKNIIKEEYSIKTISNLNSFYAVEVFYTKNNMYSKIDIPKEDLLDHIIYNSNKGIKCSYICKKCFLDFNDNASFYHNDSASFYHNYGVFYMLSGYTNVYDEDEEIIKVLQIASVKDSEDYELVRMTVYSINNLLQKKLSKNLEPAEISYLRTSFNYIKDMCKLDLKLINYKGLK